MLENAEQSNHGLGAIGALEVKSIFGGSVAVVRGN